MSGASPHRAAWDETPSDERDVVAVFWISGALSPVGLCLGDWALLWPGVGAMTILGRSRSAPRFMARFEGIRRGRCHRV